MTPRPVLPRQTCLGTRGDLGAPARTTTPAYEGAGVPCSRIPAALASVCRDGAPAHAKWRGLPGRVAPAVWRPITALWGPSWRGRRDGMPAGRSPV